MVVQFSTFPVGGQESVSAEISKVIQVIIDSGLPYKVTPMSTIVEGDWDQVMSLIKACHALLAAHHNRVYTAITIDDRRGATHRLQGKLESVASKLGRNLD